MPKQILIYDDNCPLCSCYSALFVKCGLLSTEGRKSFSDLDPALLSRIDFNRSRQEIPLLDAASGHTLYGIDALLQLLGQRWHWMKATGNTQLLNWLLRKCYAFISCNRKVIVAKKCGPGKIDCAPDYNYPCRYLLIAIILIANTLVLVSVHKTLHALLPVFTVGLFHFQTACIFFTVLNLSLAFTMRKQMAVEYLGQASMLILLALLLVLPLRIFPSNTIVSLVWLSVVTLILLREYVRRMLYAGIFEANTWIAAINLASLAGWLLFVTGVF